MTETTIPAWKSAALRSGDSVLSDGSTFGDAIFTRNGCADEVGV